LYNAVGDFAADAILGRAELETDCRSSEAIGRSLAGEFELPISIP
jgi:hypothetical protein